MHLDLFLSLPMEYKQTLKVRCRIFSFDNIYKARCNLILDTGASTTSITKRLIVDELKYTNIEKGKTKKRTATGIAHLDAATISKIEIGGEFAVPDLKVDILDWEDSEIDGVIGMDILSKLYFYSDTKTFILRSTPFDKSKEG